MKKELTLEEELALLDAYFASATPEQLQKVVAEVQAMCESPLDMSPDEAMTGIPDHILVNHLSQAYGPGFF